MMAMLRKSMASRALFFHVAMRDFRLDVRHRRARVNGDAGMDSKRSLKSRRFRCSAQLHAAPRTTAAKQNPCYSKTILACDGDSLVTASFSLKYTPTPRASPA